MDHTPLIKRDRFKVQFFYLILIAVCYSDDGYLFNAIFFIDGEFILRLYPETLFTLKRCRDDKLILVCDVSVDVLLRGAGMESAEPGRPAARRQAVSVSRASILAAQMKSLSDRPPMAWVL